MNAYRTASGNLSRDADSGGVQLGRPSELDIANPLSICRYLCKDIYGIEA